MADVTSRLAHPKLATIGYQGCTIDGVLDTLREAQIGLLIDVRAVAQSRKPGFSKRQLTAGLDQVGIGYIFICGASAHPKAVATPFGQVTRSE